PSAPRAVLTTQRPRGCRMASTRPSPGTIVPGATSNAPMLLASTALPWSASRTDQPEMLAIMWRLRGGAAAGRCGGIEAVRSPLSVLSGGLGAGGGGASLAAVEGGKI